MNIGITKTILYPIRAPARALVEYEEVEHPEYPECPGVKIYYKNNVDIWDKVYAYEYAITPIKGNERIIRILYGI